MIPSRPTPKVKVCPLCEAWFNTVFGKAMREKAPLAKGTPVRVPQMLSLTK